MCYTSLTKGADIIMQTFRVLPGRWSDTNQSQQEMKCGVVGNPAYDVVHVQGSAGDGLEQDYNMENNPFYEMRIKSNERHSHKTETAAGASVYENVENVGSRK